MCEWYNVTAMKDLFTENFFNLLLGFLGILLASFTIFFLIDVFADDLEPDIVDQPAHVAPLE